MKNEVPYSAWLYISKEKSQWRERERASLTAGHSDGQSYVAIFVKKNSS